MIIGELNNMAKPTTSRKNKIRWNELSKEMRIQHPFCEICSESKGIQVHHVCSKHYEKSLLRFDKRNLIVLCAKHHFSAHHAPILFLEWFKSVRPHDYQYIINKLTPLNQIRMY